MAIQSVSFGSIGPFDYDDSGDFALKTTGQLSVAQAATAPNDVLRFGDLSTSTTTPLLIGGSLPGSTLTLRSTSGVGTTDALIFQVGNNGATEAMRIIDNGNVGIGVVAPANLLEVAGVAVATGGLFSNIAHTVGFKDDGSGAMVIRVNNSDTLFRIGADGRLGIGLVPGTGKGRAFFGGTAIATTDVGLTGWGANAVVSSVGGTDSRGTITITTSVLDTPGANPSLLLTFKDGTWTTVPFATANMLGVSTGPLAGVAVDTAATTLKLTYIGTPTAISSKTYVFEYICIG